MWLKHFVSKNGQRRLARLVKAGRKDSPSSSQDSSCFQKFIAEHKKVWDHKEDGLK